MRISILGAGLIGRVIARELASEEGAQVSVFDADPDALDRVARETHATILRTDLSRPGAVSDVFGPLFRHRTNRRRGVPGA